MPITTNAAAEVSDVRRLLASTNPVPGARLAGLDEDPRALSLLAAITSLPRDHAPASHQPRRHARRFAFGALVAAATSLVVFASGVVEVPGHRGPAISGAYAATPPLLSYKPLRGAADAQPGALLDVIADRVAALPDDVGQGRYVLTSTQSWSLWTRVDGPQVTSRVVPAQTTTWAADDGSGASITSYRQAFHPARPERFPAGERATMWRIGSLSSDPSVLDRQLSEGHPASDGPAERLVALSDAYLEQPLGPAVRAAMLRYLAATPTLRVTGDTVDRLGRAGVAFSLDSDTSGLPTRYTVVVDPKTGRILDVEQTLTTTAGKLNVPVPSVIGYTAYRPTTRTNHLPA